VTLPTPVLNGLNILIVEDEFLVAMQLKHVIQDLGGQVLGPVSTLTAAQNSCNDQKSMGLLWT
jgi:hypothetical protein